MGCSYSCELQPPPPFNTVRVVHLKGYVEDFEQPTTVAHVTGKSPKHILCTRAQLMSGSLKPLKPDTQLEPGHVYFLLPFSTFRSDISPVDLACMARKLLTVARSSRPGSKSTGTNILSNPHGIWSSPAKSPDRLAVQCTRMEPESDVVAYGLSRSSKTRSWRPVLDTIIEKSFNRISESDLQEMQSEALK